MRNIGLLRTVPPRLRIPPAQRNVVVLAIDSTYKVAKHLTKGTAKGLATIMNTAGQLVNTYLALPQSWKLLWPQSPTCRCFGQVGNKLPDESVCMQVRSFVFVEKGESTDHIAPALSDICSAIRKEREVRPAVPVRLS